MEDYGAFSTGGLWRPSIFTIGTDAQDSIFEGLHVNEHSRLALKRSNGNLFEELLDGPDLPPIEDVTTRDDFDQQLLRADFDASAQVDPGQHQDLSSDEHDVWNFDTEPTSPLAESRLHTWEAFQLKEDEQSNSVYFSEAGDNAFNAILQKREKSTGIIQHDVTLRACCSLVLGRSSVLFRWDVETDSFSRILEQVALSGLSLLSSHSLTQQFIDMGSLFRKLSNFATQSNINDCTAIVALRRSTGDLLDHVERHVCEQLICVRSLLQLQRVTAQPWHVLEHIGALLEKLHRARTDEALISLLSDEVTALAESGNMLVGITQQILAHASMPWLQRLVEDVGLTSGLRTNGLEDTFDPIQTAMADDGFLDAEDISTLTSVRRSICLLQRHVPSHPLVKPDASLQKSDILQATSSCDPETLGRKADEYQHHMASAILRYRQGLSNSAVPTLVTPLHAHVLTPENNGPFALSALDDLAVLEPETLEQVSPRTHVYSELRSNLDLVLAANNEYLDVDPPQIACDVLAPLRPFIHVQASLVNNAVMSYIFNTYQLRDHLELHKSYHLFGNGDFVTRLATALFSDEVQTAERKRGNIPTSKTMGLRLGSRESQRWPPASSELRLTLLNVLSESYAPGAAQTKQSQLPGGLSFAIRELSDAEIDQVMDPTSIYALDFLRLQYTPPSPLANIFTPAVVQHYDAVFRTLLVHVRVLHATSQLATLCNKESQQSTSTIGSQTVLRRFAWKARHLSTAIFSHFTDTVIAMAWKTFSEHLVGLQPPEDSDPAYQVADLHSITRLHEACLDDIRSKMFLRQKYAKLRSVLEELASVVIKTTLASVHDSGNRSSVAEQECRFDALSGELRALLDVMANKPSRENRSDGLVRHAPSESDAAKLLLARLSWQGAMA